MTHAGDTPGFACLVPSRDLLYYEDGLLFAASGRSTHLDGVQRLLFDSVMAGHGSLATLASHLRRLRPARTAAAWADQLRGSFGRHTALLTLVDLPALAPAEVVLVDLAPDGPGAETWRFFHRLGSRTTCCLIALTTGDGQADHAHDGTIISLDRFRSPESVGDLRCFLQAARQIVGALRPPVLYCASNRCALLVFDMIGASATTIRLRPDWIGGLGRQPATAAVMSQPRLSRARARLHYALRTIERPADLVRLDPLTSLAVARLEWWALSRARALQCATPARVARTMGRSALLVGDSTHARPPGA